MIKRFVTSIALLFAVLAPALHGGAASAAPAAQVTRQVQRLERLVFRGTTAPTPLNSFTIAVPNYPGAQVRPQQRGERDVHPGARLRSSAFAAPAVAVPVAPSLPVVPAEPDFFGFNGVSHLDQRNAGTGKYVNTQFSLEPPDQGLCAGNGYVIDVVNNAFAVYSRFGSRLTAPTALSQFFGLAPEIANRLDPKPTYGPFVSDPRCYFDRDTQRWFLTELEIDVDPKTGADLPHSALLIAVSTSADPTHGYRLFAIDSTDATNPDCPCFGDQPLIGADANGFYISTNEFPIDPTVSGFNGSQIYALSKRGLTTGQGSAVVHIDTGGLPAPDIGGTWYSIQPSESPDTSVAAQTLNGTEYFTSALDFFNLNDNRVAVWAITNTRSLRNASPRIGFQHVVIRSTAYGPPPPAVQRPGLTPLATSLKEPLELLDTNDDRMQQVVYAAGRLWSGVATALRTTKGINTGIAFFAVAPSFDGSGFLHAQIAHQGYVAVAGQTIMFPSIGVNAGGHPVLAATLVGPAYFPTAVYVTPDGKVHVAGPGAGPDDGFTAYAAYGGDGTARWGDYSAAVADPDGSIWVAAEYIPAGERTLLANWGTFVGHVQPH